MRRKAILQLVLPLIGLSVLFCLLAFAPGEKHSQPPLLEMSVILRDGDGGVSTMRKGMEQAAEDLNVELRFLTPAEDNNAAEQVQLLEREVAGGAPAVVLLPADRELLSGAVSAAAAGKTTLVTVETDMTAWGAAASVSMDHQALGEALGTAERPFLARNTRSSAVSVPGPDRRRIPMALGSWGVAMAAIVSDIGGASLRRFSSV